MVTAMGDVELKTRVKAYGRLRLAEQLGMGYMTLSNKLNGYAAWLPGEREKAIEILAREGRRGKSK